MTRTTTNRTQRDPFNDPRTDNVAHAVQVALIATFEDGERREDVGGMVKLPALATSDLANGDFTKRPEAARYATTLTLEDGSVFELETIVRRSVNRADGAEWCMADARFERKGDACTHDARSR